MRLSEQKRVMPFRHGTREPVLFLVCVVFFIFHFAKMFSRVCVGVL